MAGGLATDNILMVPRTKRESWNQEVVVSRRVTLLEGSENAPRWQERTEQPQAGGNQMRPTGKSHGEKAAVLPWAGTGSRAEHIGAMKE